MSRILIVDDKEDNLYYLEVLLTGYGHHTETARHGAEALVKARQMAPDVVISDLLMPVMDGYTLLRHWKADIRLRRVPFIVYTATYTTAEDERLALDLGADAFILKPAEPEEFLARITEVLEHGGPVEPRAAAKDPAGERELLEVYSQTLIRKLEEKTLELEETNRALQRDIGERKAVEAALRSSEAELRLLAEAMPQIVWITRADGWNVFFNQHWSVYTGMTAAESAGNGWLIPFHLDDRGRAEAAWNVAVATGGVYSVECRLRRHDGVYKWWLIRGVPVRDANGTILKWFGTCTDIDELKMAELRISESEARFSKVFHSGLVAVSIVELTSGRVVDVNERCADFFGYSPAEMIGRTVFELGLWTDPDDRDRLIARVLTAGTQATAEAAMRRKSGEVRRAQVSMEAVRLPGIADPLVMTALVDVTERRQLEAQLLQAQKMEAIGRLAGGVAHDFNNVLSVIQGYAELLLVQAGEIHRSKLEQILRATQRATGLTRQLLAFSRKQIVDPKVVDLGALVADVQTLVGRLLGEDIELDIEAEAGLGQVRVDPGQLEQVVVNLCVNARDAMPTGGSLRIATSNVELDAASLVGHEPLEPGRYVRLVVSDTGNGIAEDLLPKIFEPFFTTKEPGKGTGLGLAMVYGIVRQAGGAVWVDSRVGEGSRFTICLPRIDGRVDDTAAPEASAPPGGSETILVVEDEAPLRAIVREVLEGNGYRVIEAGSAEDAIARSLVAGNEIDLLLTDIVLPGMNGRRLAEAMTAHQSDLRVLYMTGYTEEGIANRGVLLPGLLVLAKPFTAHALLAHVREALAS